MTAAVENNVISFLQKAARRVPDRPALIFGEGQRASFADLWERSDRISAGLGRAGLSPGDRVIVMIPMSLELYAVMLGLLKLGAVACQRFAEAARTAAFERQGGFFKVSLAAPDQGVAGPSVEVGGSGQFGLFAAPEQGGLIEVLGGLQGLMIGLSAS